MLTKVPRRGLSGMPTLRALISLVFCASLNPAWACPGTKPDCTIDKKDWVALISVGLPVAFCKDDSPFRKCYEMSQSQCIDILLSATKQCIAEQDDHIPQSMSKSESKKWGGNVGSCAEDKLAAKVHLKKDKGTNCAATQPLHLPKP